MFCSEELQKKWVCHLRRQGKDSRVPVSIPGELVVVVGAPGNLVPCTAEEDEERNTVLDHQCCACLVLVGLQLNPAVCSPWHCPCPSGCREPGTEKETEHLNARNIRKMLAS